MGIPVGRRTNVYRRPSGCMRRYTSTRVLYFNVLVTPVTQMFNHIVATSMVPEAWGVSLLTAIYKGKGDPAQPTNYRGIAVTCILAKVFSSVIEARLFTFLEEGGGEEAMP